jgi:hypothetical protein
MSRSRRCAILRAEERESENPNSSQRREVGGGDVEGCAGKGGEGDGAAEAVGGGRKGGVALEERAFDDRLAQRDFALLLGVDESDRRGEAFKCFCETAGRWRKASSQNIVGKM